MHLAECLDLCRCVFVCVGSLELVFINLSVEMCMFVQFLPNE